MRRRGFSLVELLVVIAIIAALLGLTIPAVQKLRTASARTYCLNNLHNQAAAVLAFEATQGRLPPGAVSGPASDSFVVPEGVSHGMYSCLLGFLVSNDFAAEYRWDVSYYAVENQPAVRTRFGVLICPGSATFPQSIFEYDDNDNPVRWGAGCHYGGVVPSSIFVDFGWSEPDLNFAGALPANGRGRSGDVKDGTANTILLAENGKGAAWASPETLSAARDVFPGGVPGGAAHPGGFCAAMCDGSTRFLLWTMNPRTFAALCTRAGGETINDSDW